MKTQETQKTEATTQKIQLVKGEFTPSEASHIIMKLIDEKINFHKIQRLQIFEGNTISQTPELNDRIKELQKEKEVVREFIKNNRQSGYTMKIDGVLEISVSK